jgi:hypothetical protein
MEVENEATETLDRLSLGNTSSVVSGDGSMVGTSIYVLRPLEGTDPIDGSSNPSS